MKQLLSAFMALVATSAAIFLYACQPAHAQNMYAQVVASCGTPNVASPQVGTWWPATVDLNGRQCSSAAGGGGGPATIADGADVALGSIANSASCAVSTTLLSCLRQLHTDITTSAIPAGSALIGFVSADPCAQSKKNIAQFSSSTSGGSIITASASNKAYICSISIVTTGAANVSLIEGTGVSVCTGGTTAGVYLNNGVTAAGGAAFAANGGIQAGDGNSTVAVNSVTNQNVCVIMSVATQVNVTVGYVYAP